MDDSGQDTAQDSRQTAKSPAPCDKSLASGNLPSGNLPGPGGHYKRDWSARKPYYVLKLKDGSGNFLVIINERKLVTKTPIPDLIASLEELIQTLEEEYDATDPAPKL